MCWELTLLIFVVLLYTSLPLSPNHRDEVIFPIGEKTRETFEFFKHRST